MCVAIEQQDNRLSADQLYHQQNGWKKSVQKGWAMLGLWWQRQRQRKQLATLDPRLLKDMGITQDKLYDELSKPFWR